MTLSLYYTLLLIIEHFCSFAPSTMRTKTLDMLHFFFLDLITSSYSSCCIRHSIFMCTEAGYNLEKTDFFHENVLKLLPSWVTVE